MTTRRSILTTAAAASALASGSTSSLAAADEARRNKDVVRGFFELIYKGQAEKAFDENCSSDYDFSIFDPDNTRLNSVILWAGILHKGREGFLELNDLLFGRSVDVLKFELGDMFADNDMVVVFGQFRFKARPTGKEFASEFVVRYWLHDGKMVRGRFFEDTFSVADGFRHSGTWDVENAGSRRII
jgi:ketosteroid isomerase-like protein